MKGSYGAVGLPEAAPVHQKLDALLGREAVVKPAVGTQAVFQIPGGLADGLLAHKAMVPHHGQVGTVQVGPPTQEVYEKFGQVSQAGSLAKCPAASPRHNWAIFST
jgi:hypothetical protein